MNVMSDIIHRHLVFVSFHSYFIIIILLFFFQGHKPSLTEASSLPSFTQTAPYIGQVPYHPSPEFMFTGTDHKPLQYLPVPSVYDPPNEVAEDHVDRKYSNGNMNHHQRNRHKRL
jgi:hypothetical protein